jgi:hypothetical protein
VPHTSFRDDVGWDLIKDIQKRYLARRYAKPKLKHLRALAIDEIAAASGHRYLTVVLDLDGGAVVFVGEGAVYPGRPECDLDPDSSVGLMIGSREAWLRSRKLDAGTWDARSPRSKPMD